jgi:hypothetical protein
MSDDGFDDDFDDGFGFFDDLDYQDDDELVFIPSLSSYTTRPPYIHLVTAQADPSSAHSPP